MDQGNLMNECYSLSAHMVKEQHAPDEHCEIALFNTNNEFNRAINEDDIDFNTPGLPHSAVKQLNGLTFKIWLRKSRTTRIDTLFKKTYKKSQSFNPFSQ